MPMAGGDMTLLPPGWIFFFFCTVAFGLVGLSGVPLSFLLSLFSGLRGGLPGARAGDLKVLEAGFSSNLEKYFGRGTGSNWVQGVFVPPEWMSLDLVFSTKSVSPKLTLVAALKLLCFLII